MRKLKDLLGTYRNYSRVMDHWGYNVTIKILDTADPERIFALYRKEGHSVRQLADVRHLPFSVVEYQVSLQRRMWRRWIWSEMGLGLMAGPLGPVVVVSGLAFILTRWGIEMGYAYGLDMRDSQRLQTLREIIGRGLSDSVKGSHNRPHCRKLGCRIKHISGQGFLLFLGPDLIWADDIMAKIRRQWRRESLTIRWGDGPISRSAPPSARDPTGLTMEACNSNPGP